MFSVFCSPFDMPSFDALLLAAMFSFDSLSVCCRFLVSYFWPFVWFSFLFFPLVPRFLMPSHGWAELDCISHFFRDNKIATARLFALGASIFTPQFVLSVMSLCLYFASFVALLCPLLVWFCSPPLYIFTRLYSKILVRSIFLLLRTA